MLWRGGRVAEQNYAGFAQNDKMYTSYLENACVFGMCVWHVACVFGMFPYMLSAHLIVINAFSSAKILNLKFWMCTQKNLKVWKSCPTSIFMSVLPTFVMIARVNVLGSLSVICSRCVSSVLLLGVCSKYNDNKDVWAAQSFGLFCRLVTLRVVQGVWEY